MKINKIKLTHLYLLFCLIFGLSSCDLPIQAQVPTLTAEQNQGQTLTEPTAVKAIGFNLDTLKNSEYHFNIVAESLPDTQGVVKLTDGVWEKAYPDAASKVIVQYITGAAGDLNMDGRDDALAVIAIDTGGSGNFIHLAALTDDGSSLRQQAERLLGDRVKLKSLLIQDGKIILTLLMHAPQDPLCCPTQETQVEYELQDGNLK